MDVRRHVPRTDAVLAEPRVTAAVQRLGRARVKGAVAAAQERARRGELPADAVVEAALAALPQVATSLHPVLNATGVLLHTNLGRAPLSAAARAALQQAAGTCDVEFDLPTGGRGPRGTAAIDALLAAVPGAGAAHRQQRRRGAALVASALAFGREIVIARGELVEIGAGFRIPDLITSTGARLREVGATNRVDRADYAAAIGPDTAFVLKVHPSNFTVSGFTRSCEVAELVDLGVPVVADIGSGLLAPHPLLPDEPDATTTLAAGADLVTASGDKLLGGPQAGLLLGARRPGAELVPAASPLARALRVDKLTLAAFEATLPARTPDPDALDRRPAALRARADGSRLTQPRPAPTPRLRRRTVGGGGAPGVVLPSGGGAARALRRRAAHRRPRRAGSDRARSLCARSARVPTPRTATVAARARGRCSRQRRCTSSPRPGTSTTASPTLVRALTGMEPDRFAEERRRGMTIDLGFAWTTLPSRGRSPSSTSPVTSGS